MTRLAFIAAAAAACATVSPAPPGTPPLVIQLADPLVPETLAVDVAWEARCEATSTNLDITSDHESLDIGTSTSRDAVACNRQAFTARASCVPGPCTVVAGLGGTSRTVRVAFGQLGPHRLTLVIANGAIAKTWTGDVEVVVADALRIGCSYFDGVTTRPCRDGVARASMVFAISADAFAGGRRLAGARPTVRLIDARSDGPTPTAAGLIAEGDGVHWRAYQPGRYLLRAEFDGLIADLPLVVAP
ncbi:MAG: hypothetical protein JNK64_21890 [Myxococcales bacterium]|nr:hypothetical protein [Myxococcales bacterium]